MQQTYKKNMRYNYIAINKIKKYQKPKRYQIKTKKYHKLKKNKTIPNYTNYKRNIKMVASK